MLTQNIAKSKKYRGPSGPKAVMRPILDTSGLRKANDIWYLSPMTASMTASKKAVIGCHRLSWRFRALQSPKGPKGPKRPKGPKGPKRPKGPKGPKGPKSPKSPKGSLALHGTSAT